jgi:hypothetical protein
MAPNEQFRRHHSNYRCALMPGRLLQVSDSHRETIGTTSARLCNMKSTLQPVEHLGRFERRAIWRDTHSEQGKSLAQIAQSLGVRL